MSRRFEVNEDESPDVPGMMLVTVEALKALGGSASISELNDKVVDIEEVSEAEQSIPMPNPDIKKTKLNYYLGWARTHLRRGGAIDSSKRGVWFLTIDGKDIQNIEQAQAIYESRHAHYLGQAPRNDTATEGEPESRVPADTLTSDMYSEDESSNWQHILLSIIGKMQPEAFERLARQLLREAGFIDVEVRGKSGDGGIDGVGMLRVNLISFRVYFQCKKWESSIGAKEIRDFRGALQGRADKGLFITTSSFTKQAMDEATRDGAIAIDLIDGERLCDLLKEYELGVATVEQVEINEKLFSEI